MFAAAVAAAAAATTSEFTLCNITIYIFEEDEKSMKGERRWSIILMMAKNCSAYVVCDVHRHTKLHQSSGSTPKIISSYMNIVINIVAIWFSNSFSPLASIGTLLNSSSLPSFHLLHLLLFTFHFSHYRFAFHFRNSFAKVPSSFFRSLHFFILLKNCTHTYTHQQLWLIHHTTPHITLFSRLKSAGGHFLLRHFEISTLDAKAFWAAVQLYAEKTWKIIFFNA